MHPVQCVGLTLEAATELVEAFGMKLRIKKVDGQPRMLTADYRTDRVNVVVEKGIVINAEIG